MLQPSDPPPLSVVLPAVPNPGYIPECTDVDEQDVPSKPSSSTSRPGSQTIPSGSAPAVTIRVEQPAPDPLRARHSPSPSHPSQAPSFVSDPRSQIASRKPSKLSAESCSNAAAQSRKGSTGSNLKGPPQSIHEVKKAMGNKRDKHKAFEHMTEEERMATLRKRMSLRLSGVDLGVDPEALPGSPAASESVSRMGDWKGADVQESSGAALIASENQDARASVPQSRTAGSSVLTWSAREGRKRRASEACEACRRRLEPRCRKLNKNKFFQATMFGALLAALFLPDVWIIANRPDNTDLDIVLTIVLLLFLLEFSVQSIGLTRTYVRSFFFYMDIVGAFSLLLDLSYLGIMSLIGGGDSMSNNVAIMRAARMAKLGARAGRFTRLVKLLRFLPGMGGDTADQGTAKAISSRLITALSTRVSGLIIVMVMVMPLFSFWTFPDQDWSMTSWMDVLEQTLAQHPERLDWQIDRFSAFYEEQNYHPYRLELKEGTSKALPWQSPNGAPAREGNVLKYETSSLICFFNFQSPNQIDSVMNVLLLIFIMGLMIGFSLVLSNSVSKIVLHPVEKLLMAVRNVASMIFKSVTEVAAKIDDEKEEEEDEEELEDNEASKGFGHEIKLLERVVQKLGVLSNTLSKNAQEEAKEDEVQVEDAGATASQMMTAFAHSVGYNPDADQQIDLFQIQKEIVEKAGLNLDLLNSWNLNPLELDQARNKAAVEFFLGPHAHGVMFDNQVMQLFLEQVENGYSRTTSYHSWFHAVDVTHCVYRFMNLLDVSNYLGGLDRFALLMSAVGHDLGHPGYNNLFLVETSHELALRYNDVSPLENMHCAKLFELLTDECYDVFSMLQKGQRLTLRQLIIDVILHTDNSKHFQMVKEVQTLYELSSDTLDAAKDSFHQDAEWPTQECIDSFRQTESKKLLMKLLLHMADISNPMKPFRICRIWASQVFEEFFAQGDAEKRLGVPVQAMNDREKVNRALSQIGFVEFMVSPLVFAVVKVLPPLEANAEMLVQNCKSWYDIWLKDAKTPPSEDEKKAVRDRIQKLENKCVELME